GLLTEHAEGRHRRLACCGDPRGDWARARAAGPIRDAQGSLRRLGASVAADARARRVCRRRPEAVDAPVRVRTRSVRQEQSHDVRTRGDPTMTSKAAENATPSLS